MAKQAEQAPGQSAPQESKDVLLALNKGTKEYGF